MNEPLAFGLGSGLFYIHIPFLKVNGGPAISFRSMPGSIFKKTCKALNVNIQRKKFRSALVAEKFLDDRLDAGDIVDFNKNCSSKIIIRYKTSNYLI